MKYYKSRWVLPFLIICLFSIKNVRAQTYNIGDIISINNEDYYTIVTSDNGQDYVTVLKALPLTVEEVNTYGGVGTENNYVNKYTDSHVGTVHNQSGYGGMAYYSSSTCGTVNDTPIYSGCTTDYNLSDVKQVVDAWAADKFKNNELKTVEGYSARLPQKEELRPIGWPSCSETASCQQEDNTPSWLLVGTSYWTMTSNNFYVWVVANYMSGLSNGGAIYTSYVTVRPVINIKKSYFEPKITPTSPTNDSKTDAQSVLVENTALQKSLLATILGIALIAIALTTYILFDKGKKKLPRK